MCFIIISSNAMRKVVMHFYMDAISMVNSQMWQCKHRRKKGITHEQFHSKVSHQCAIQSSKNGSDCFILFLPPRKRARGSLWEGGKEVRTSIYPTVDFMLLFVVLNI